MTSERILRERQLWIAIVAILVTASAWLALIDAALLLRAVGPDLGDVVVVIRVVARTILSFVALTKPLIVAAAAAVTLLIGWIAVGRGEDLGHKDLGQEGAIRV
jgi:hypothetical protein